MTKPGAVEGGPAIGRLLDVQPGRTFGVQNLGQIENLGQRIGVTTNQSQGTPAQFIAAEYVAQDTQAKRHARGPEQDNFDSIAHRDFCLQLVRPADI